MDRRLPVKPGPFFGQLARRELILEQRLDQLATMRKRSQRYLNPPCCADTDGEWWYEVTVDDPISDDNAASDGVTVDVPAGTTLTSFYVEAEGAEEDASGLVISFEIDDVEVATFDLVAEPTGGYALEPPLAVTAGSVLMKCYRVGAGSTITTLYAEALFAGPIIDNVTDTWPTEA